MLNRYKSSGTRRSKHCVSTLCAPVRLGEPADWRTILATTHTHTTAAAAVVKWNKMRASKREKSLPFFSLAWQTNIHTYIGTRTGHAQVGTAAVGGTWWENQYGATPPCRCVAQTPPQLCGWVELAPSSYVYGGTSSLRHFSLSFS